MLRGAALATLAALVVASPAQARLSVKAPRPGTTLQATQHARVQAVRLVVRGRAGRGQTVRLSAPCVLRLCIASTVADRRGRWSSGLDLVIPARTRRLALTVALPVTGEHVDLAVNVRKPPPPAPVPGRRWLVMTGDSLAVGTAAALPAQLPELNVTTNAVSGRFLAQGMAVLGDTPLPSGPILGFSLFTNDDARNVVALEAAVRGSVTRAGPRGCAVWATVHRGRTSYSRANALLRRLAGEPGLAGRLEVVPWAAHVRRHRVLLRRDGVHATPAGYLARARLYAEAARRCAT